MKKVMIVDDEKDITDLFEGILRDFYEVIKAYGGREALQKLEADKPDLIVLDINMPDINGMKVLEKIKQSPELKDIPVIMLTAVKPEISILELKIEDYLVKPVSSNKLISAIGDVFKSIESISQFEAAALSLGVERKFIEAYKEKVHRVKVNERLLTCLRQIFTLRGINNIETHRSLMKSFERAINLEKEEVHRLQVEMKLEMLSDNGLRKEHGKKLTSGNFES